jgi:dTDP-4-dehydrorhamnose reductase
MRVLVTGANGLVGSRACAALVSAGHVVTGAGRGPLRAGVHLGDAAQSAERGAPGAHGPLSDQPARSAEGASSRASAAFTYVVADLTRPEDVARAVEAARPDAILHAAAMTEVDACERAPLEAWAHNVTASELIAREARRTGAHLVAISTDYVFDGEAGPYSEEDIPNPRGAYAASKFAGELAVRTLAPSWAIARTAVVYGWPPAARLNFGAWLLSKLEKGEPVNLFEDQFVSPSLADSVAEMVVELTVKKHQGIWNTCGGAVVNRVEFGRALCGVFGFDPSLIQPSLLANAGLASPRPKRSGLKSDKAAASLGAKPLSLLESLRRFHAARKST